MRWIAVLIGELSRRTGVSQRLLRYYEEQGLIEVERGPNGYRRYREDAVDVVCQIRGLLNAGLSTEVIRSIQPCARGAAPELDLCPELRAILRRELAAMDERIENLRASRGALAKYANEA